MRYIQLMQTTQFVVFQLAKFFLFFFTGKYLISFVPLPFFRLRKRHKLRRKSPSKHRGHAKISGVKFLFRAPSYSSCLGMGITCHS